MQTTKLQRVFINQLNMIHDIISNRTLSIILAFLRSVDVAAFRTIVDVCLSSNFRITTWRPIIVQN